MADELVVPGSDDFCSFVDAYFDFSGSWDRRSNAGHDIYRVEGVPRNISIPRGRPRLNDRTFSSLLSDMGINRAIYRELAGTSIKLKSFVKSKRDKQ